MSMTQFITVTRSQTELNYLNVEDQSQAWIFTRDVF